MMNEVLHCPFFNHSINIVDLYISVNVVFTSNQIHNIHMFI